MECHRIVRYRYAGTQWQMERRRWLEIKCGIRMAGVFRVERSVPSVPLRCVKKKSRRTKRAKSPSALIISKGREERREVCRCALDARAPIDIPLMDARRPSGGIGSW